MELSILMPCLNEELTLGRCISKALDFLQRNRIEGEVLVADNGSTDRSKEIAQSLGARVVDVPTRGYGAALQAGIEQAHGRYVILGDADDSYDFSRLELYLERLRAGDQLVMGNRFAGGIMPGAMPFLHRWLGNPVLSYIGRLFFKTPIRDFHCGLRGGERDALLSLRLSAPGMEFASEMVVKASLAKLRISEVPTVLHKDGRDRPPHLRTWRDGWRHLRFLLAMSPSWLFLVPGCALLAVGLPAMIVLALGPVQIGDVGLGIHTMLYAAEATLLGWQLLLFFVLARTIGTSLGVLPPGLALDDRVRALTLERGLMAGLLMLGLGLAMSVWALQVWVSGQMGALDPTQMMRLTIPSATLALAGAELTFAAFVVHFVQSAAPARNGV